MKIEIEIELTPEKLVEMCHGQFCPRRLILCFKDIMKITDEEKRIVESTKNFNGFCNYFRRNECKKQTAEKWRCYLEQAKSSTV